MKNQQHNFVLPGISILSFIPFLTVNVLGLGLVAQHVDQASRMPIVAAFIGQNIISAGTAVVMAIYTRAITSNLSKIAIHIRDKTQDYDEGIASIVCESPVATKISYWAAWANFATHPLLAVCWIAVLQAK